MTSTVCVQSDPWCTHPPADVALKVCVVRTFVVFSILLDTASDCFQTVALSLYSSRPGACISSDSTRGLLRFVIDLLNNKPCGILGDRTSLALIFSEFIVNIEHVVDLQQVVRQIPQQVDFWLFVDSCCATGVDLLVTRFVVVQQIYNYVNLGFGLL